MSVPSGGDHDRRLMLLARDTARNGSSWPDYFIALAPGRCRDNNLVHVRSSLRDQHCIAQTGA